MVPCAVLGLKQALLSQGADDIGTIPTNSLKTKTIEAKSSKTAQVMIHGQVDRWQCVQDIKYSCDSRVL